MSQNENLLRRLDELIELGQKFVPNMQPTDLFDQWRYSCQNLLNQIYPGKYTNENSSQYKLLFTSYRIDTTRRLYALLKATKEDLEKGLIGNLEHKIKRVEMNSLLDYSYKLFDENDDALDRCACVLSRIVLEKTLQIFCEKNDIQFAPKTKASVLNQKLREKSIYNLTQMKEIDYLLSIGNYASHPGVEWEKTKPQQRRKAVRDIEDLFKRLV